MLKRAFLLLALPLAAQVPPRTAGPVTVKVQPARTWIEAGDQAQHLAVDFELENHGDTPLGLDRLDLVVRDRAGKVVVRRFLDDNGLAPSLETLPLRVLAPKSRWVIFNPFQTFKRGLDLAKLTYTFSLSIPNEAPETRVAVDVTPTVYAPKAVLSLPLKGRILVHDGHDLYSHHRRLDTQHPVALKVGIGRNTSRYALDLNTADADFAPYRNEGRRNEDWYAWGQPLHAPGDGVVVVAVGAEPDNQRGEKPVFNPLAVTDPMQFYGNRLVIDHGHGEFTIMGHLLQGSLAVRVGDKVRRGQVVAKVGSSGSSLNPHVHFELRDGKDLNCEGLPAIFHRFRRHLGARVERVRAAAVDTGDLLENP